MPEINRQLREAMANAPYGQRLGFRLVELTEGYAKVAVAIAPEHLNFMGKVDGGLVMSLADYAFGCSGNTFGQVRVAVQFSTNFIAAPPPSGELVAEGRTVHVGRSILLTEITVTDESGKLVAKATGTAVTLPNETHMAGKTVPANAGG